MAQIPGGRLVKGPYKPICRDCAIYFSLTVKQSIYAEEANHLGIEQGNPIFTAHWVVIHGDRFVWKSGARDHDQFSDHESLILFIRRFTVTKVTRGLKVRPLVRHDA